MRGATARQRSRLDRKGAGGDVLQGSFRRLKAEPTLLSMDSQLGYQRLTRSGQTAGFKCVSCGFAKRGSTPEEYGSLKLTLLYSFGS